MKVGRTLYVTTAKAWRAWLRRNHSRAREIWLVYYRKGSGKARIPYNDAVDEALCFGWIDSTLKKLPDGGFAQRFTPRKRESKISEMNRARVRRLVAEKRMTTAGLAALDNFKDVLTPPKLVLRADVRRALQADPETWRNFEAFPETYKRIRIGWIEAARERMPAFRTRLRYFAKMTKANKRFGMVQE